MDSEDKNRTSLDDRIRQVEEGRAKKPPADSSSRAGFDFVGSIVGAGVLGAVADHVFDTAPWCLLGMIGVGFVGGMVAVWRSLQKNSEPEK